MVRSLLVRGLLAGLIAGLFGLVFAYVAGEPAVRSAIAVEEAGGAGHTHGDSPAVAVGEKEDEVVSRDVQSTVGLATGMIAYGVAVGGIFALVFATALGRIGRIGARGTAALLAVIGWVSVVLVPFLKYPANPPAVGQGDSTGRRTVLFLSMILASVAIAWLAVHVRGRLVARLGGWNATLVAGGGYVVVMLAVAAFLPQVQEVPADFPPTLLWQFRTVSLGTQLALWTALGIAFGLLARRVVERPATAAPAPEPVPIG